MNTIALHGTFGGPEDFENSEHASWVPNLTDLEPERFENLESWAESLVPEVLSKGAASSLSLVGYSLGARLAVHLARALERRGTPCESLVLISMMPGLIDERARSERLARDQEWARRLRSEPLEMVMSAWDAQPVFGGIARGRPRDLSRLNREAWAHVVARFSPGRERPVGQMILDLRETPVRMVGGALDTAWVQAWNQGPWAQEAWVQLRQVLPGVGHRVRVRV